MPPRDGHRIESRTDHTVIIFNKYQVGVTGYDVGHLHCTGHTKYSLGFLFGFVLGVKKEFIVPNLKSIEHTCYAVIRSPQHCLQLPNSPPSMQMLFFSPVIFHMYRNKHMCIIPHFTRPATHDTQAYGCSYSSILAVLPGKRILRYISA